MARTLPTAAAVAAVTIGKGSSSSNSRSVASRTRRRKYSGLTEQDDHRRLNSNGTNASGKENEGNTSSDAVHYFLSPPPNKNKKNMMSAPKKKKLARTTTMQLRHDHPSYNPVTYYHKTPSSSSTDAVMVLMTLPPCTALLDFNSNKEYLDLATPRVLLDQFEKDTTATAAPPSLGDLEGTKDV